MLFPLLHYYFTATTTITSTSNISTTINNNNIINNSSCNDYYYHLDHPGDYSGKSLLINAHNASPMENGVTRPNVFLCD